MNAEVQTFIAALWDAGEVLQQAHEASDPLPDPAVLSEQDRRRLHGGMAPSATHPTK